MIETKKGTVKVGGDLPEIWSDYACVLLSCLEVTKKALKGVGDKEEVTAIIGRLFTDSTAGALEAFKEKTGIDLLDEDEEAEQEWVIPSDKLKDFIEGKGLLF